MPNGTLVSALDTAQQLAIVKNPGNSNQYYVFTTGANGLSNNSFRISYSIVDMTLGSIDPANGAPLGDVMYRFKQIPVLDDLGNIFYTEAITIVPNSDGLSYWVLIPNDKRLYAYRLDSNGFDNGHPVISNLEVPISGNHYGVKASPKIYGNNFTHYLCISPWADTYVAYSLPDNYFTNDIYSFDAATGQLTNDFSLHVNALRAYTPEFNKDSSVLFLGANDVYAVDLLNSTTSSVQSMMVYDDPQPYNPGTGIAIQRNKYDDIYVSKNYKLYLSQITNPDVYGPGIGFNLNAIYLGGTGSTTSGLPQLIPNLERRPEGYYPCIDDLVLTHENNLSFYYKIGKTITAKDKYILGPKHTITMQASRSVTLLPGTDIQKGAQYYGFIAPCGKNDTGLLSKTTKRNANQKGMTLKLDIEERKMLGKEISVYPNPASQYININTGNEKLISWEIYDMSGKLVLKGNTTPINIQTMVKGSYLLNISLEKKQISKTVIVK